MSFSASNTAILLERRITKLELTIIPHPSHIVAIEALESFLLRARMRRDSKSLKAKALLLYGLTGAGKTTVIEDFAARNPDVPTADGDIRRVIVVEMPEATTKRALVNAILSELGYRASHRENANDIVVGLIQKVKLIGVEMIIIDEGHHVIAGKAIQAVTEFLKSLLNRIGCQIVIVGLPELQKLHDHPQLNRRLIPDVVLEPYDWTTRPGRMEFLVLMTQFQELMGLPEDSGLGKEDLALRMYVATGGSIGLVSKYLSRALELATLRKLNKIEPVLLAEIYASWHPKLRAPDKIDFFDKLPLAEGTDPNELLSELRKVQIESDENPFLCSHARCAQIWEQKSEPGEAEPSPKRRTRGSKKRSIQVFSY